MVIHYTDFIMGTIASQINSLTIVYLTVYSDADIRKLQSSTSLAFVWGIHRGPVNSPHKWPVTRKMFPFDGVITVSTTRCFAYCIVYFCPNTLELGCKQFSSKIYTKFCMRQFIETFDLRNINQSDPALGRKHTLDVHRKQKYICI